MVYEEPKGHAADYAVQLSQWGRRDVWRVADDPEDHNQGRWANCATRECDVNAVLTEGPDGDVWLEATRDIEEGDEILIWYGTEYGSELVGYDIYAS